MKKITLILLLSIIVGAPVTIFAATFTAADFEGTWETHVLVASEGGSAWEWLRGDIDDEGNYTGLVYQNTYEDVATSDYTLSISSSGVVSMDEDNTFNGKMNDSKNLIVANSHYLDEDYRYKLYVMVKRPSARTTFSDADFAGTWDVQGMWVSDGDDAGDQGWIRGSVTGNTSGHFTPGSFLDSYDNTTPPSLPDLDISPTTGGIVMTPPRVATALRGVMNADKNLMVIVLTEGAEHYLMLILVKREDASFSANDLAGTWDSQGLNAGINSQGNYHYWYSGLTAVGTAIDANGVVTAPDTDTSQDFEGIMNADKDLVVCTESLGTVGSAYQLSFNILRGTDDDDDDDIITPACFISVLSAD